MARLYISEYEGMAELRERREKISAPQEPAVVVQTPVAIGGASAQSAPFGYRTRYVMVHTDAVCSIKFGEDPTATADDARMTADETRFFGVVPGHRVAVITNV